MDLMGLLGWGQIWGKWNCVKMTEILHYLKNLEEC